jgi:hypothetical protein
VEVVTKENIGHIEEELLSDRWLMLKENLSKTGNP